MQDEKGPAVPTVDDYPDGLLRDGRAGEARRITIDGVPVDPTRPVVSIITCVYNNAAHIGRAMQSVFAQSYRNIEYMVVDGGSTDGTVDVIRAHADRLSYWHSARDAGISDAFNMGVSACRGEFVGLVNSDDWMSADQVQRGVDTLMRTGAPFVFGDLLYHSQDDGAPLYRVQGDKHYAGKLWHRMPQVTHPTALVRRQVYLQYGLFDPRWRIGMDYDWLLRLHRAGVHGLYDPAIVGHMSLGGVSDSRWRECLIEHCAIAVQHGGPAALLKPLFAARLAKICARRFVERWLPAELVLRLREVLNPSLKRLA